jgi:hypothetical protein
MNKKLFTYPQVAHYMFSMTCELIALWKPWSLPPYSCAALFTPIELLPFFELGWYLLGPSPAVSACASADWTVWFCAGRKMT